MLPLGWSNPLGKGLGGESYADRVKGLFAGGVHWPMSDASGVIVDEALGTTVSADVVLNGDFEELVGADDFWYWSETASDGTIEDETSAVHGGSHAVKLTAGASVNTRMLSDYCMVEPGAEYALSFWTRGDGTYAGRWGIYDVTNSVWIQSLIATGNATTNYTEVTDTITAPAGCYQIRIYLYCAGTNTGVCYFDDFTLTGNTSCNGLLPAAGITYGETGVSGDAMKFSGSNTYLQIGFPAFHALWDGNVGSAICFGKQSAAANWTNATDHRYLFHVKSNDDITVYIVFGQNVDNNTVFWRRRVAGDSFEHKEVLASPPDDWFSMGFTWDKDANFAGYLYANGAFTTVFDETPATGNEEWNKATYRVNGNLNLLMAGTITTQEWIGWGQHGAYLPGVVLNGGQMRDAMVP